MSDDDFPTPEEEEKFYAAVGRAITGWADLEEVLFRMTLSILGCTKERASIIFFSRTTTLSGRLTLTNDLVNSFFPRHEPGQQPDLRIRRWRELQKEIAEHVPVRNALAHHPVGPVVELYESPDGRAREIEIRHASYKSHDAHLAKPESSPEILGINEIRAHTQLVSRLVNDLRNFDRQEVSRPNAAPGEQGVPRTLPQDRQDTGPREAQPPPPPPSRE